MKRKSEDPSPLVSTILRGKEAAMTDSRHHFTSLVHTGIPIAICFIISLIAFFFTITSAHAEVGVVVTGKVTDSKGVPLSSAHVCVSERQVIVTTDWRGQYQVTDIPPGEYTIEVSRIGFSTGRVYNVSVKEGMVSNVNVVLSKNPVVLPVVQVSSMSKELQFGENVIVVTRTEWKEQGARSVEQVLQQIPNVSILEGARNSRISLRGSPARAVKVYIDGVPLNDAGTGEADISGIRLDYLEAVAVEMDAIGGEVHFMTRQPTRISTNERQTRISSGLGSYDNTSTGIMLKGTVELVSGSVFYDRTTEKGNFKYRLDNGVEYRRYNNHLSATSGMTKLSVDVKNWALEGGIYYEDSDRGSPGLISTAPTPDAELSSRRLSASLNGHRKSETVDLRCSAFFSEYSGCYVNPAEQYNPETGRIVHYTAEDNRQTGTRLGLSTTAGIPVKTIDLLLDYDAQVDWYNGEDRLRGVSTIGGVGLGTARRITHQAESGILLKYSGWGIDWKFNPNLVQYWIDNRGADDYRMIAPSILISADKVFNFCNTGLNFSWGKMLTAPPFNALFLVESMFAVGNKDLEPEKGESWNASLYASSPFTSDLDWRFNLTFFNRKTEDLIIWRINSFGKYFPANVAHAKVSGIELNGRLQVLDRHLTLSGNYTYNDPRNDTPGDINRGNRPPLIARHNGSVSLTGRIGGFTTGVQGRWISRRYSTESNLDPISTANMELAPYNIYDLSCSYSFNFKMVDITIEAVIDNITDESYRIVERSPMLGRTYFIGLALEML